MPFKIKLKKSKQQYNVASKSIYVITVELLDNVTLECTLTADSTGRDCMDNVCQRLGLQQPDLFGLRYVSRRSYPKIRWVDLDRPLKKQLDKYAQEPYLYLSVMFYVHDVSLLEDEVTRYHYFLQLKMDVIEGRLRCNYEQAIVLASYSLQAEFGDHDPEKHTLEYLQDFPLLPKPMMSQFPEEKRGTLTDAVISQHASLRGIAQQLAEVYYIVGAQQLDGYGQECFLAKDDMGNEVLIGPSLTGIVVRKGNVLSPQFFKWNDITNLINHKRYFGIECQNYEYSVQFLLDEPDSAKYVWKMCVLQHTFYKMHASATESNELNITLENNQMSKSYNEHHLNKRNQFDMMIDPPYSTTIQHSEIQNFHQQTQMVDISPMKIQSGPQTKQSILDQQSKSIILDQTNHQSAVPLDLTGNTTLQQSFNNYVLGQSNNSVNEISPQVNSVDGQQYRQVPDYETAIRNKYGVLAAANMSQIHQQQNQQQQYNLQQSTLYNSQPSLIADSSLLPANSNVLVESHYQNKQTIQQQLLQQQQQQQQQNNDNNLHVTYSSTPELNRINLNHQIRPHGLISNEIPTTQEQVLAELQNMDVYKPPPPYPGPYAKLASTSTPDLAGMNSTGQAIVGLGGSSPDLVSRRNLPAHLIANNISNLENNHMHKTYSNLYTIDSSKNISDYRNAYSTEELNSVVYRLQNENGNLISNKENSNIEHQYSKSSDNEPIYQNQQQVISQLQLKEPIYQNLPGHEKILYKQKVLEQHQKNQESTDLESSANESIHIDETVESADLLQNAIQVHKPLNNDVINNNNSASPVTTNTNNRLKGHVSRIAITNSRENLMSNGDEVKNLNYIYDEEIVNNKVKQVVENKTVTKINIGDNNESTTTPVKVNTSSNSKTDSQIQDKKVVEKNTKNTQHMMSNYYMPEPATPDALKDLNNSHPRTPGQKPRAGRKRWALNFGSKSGSLKSIKSDGGHSHKSQDSFDGSSSLSKSTGFGPLMLATLQGLTRSRPDLLTESLTSFSKPSRMPKDEIGSYLETKLSEGEVLREFEQIPKKKIAGCFHSTAMMAENISRNRFKDVLPYEENRVKLSSSDKENKSGYINASHISATVGQDQRFYIATQGPLPNTVLHFWQMIFQCDVHLIVMLTDASSQTKTSSCIPYWPHKNGSTLEMGDFKIVKRFTNQSEDGSYTTSTLNVTHLPSKKSRTIWHLQYSDWSDHGCPSDVRKYVEFLEEISALRQHTSSEMPLGRNRNPPVLVHCSAGVGRTGVTILCDILLYCVDHNLDVDIPKILTHLRQQRMLMVQTIAQYKFVHTVLINYLKQSRLI